MTSEQKPRETIVISTTHKHSVEVKTYLTRAEMREVFVKVDKEEKTNAGKDNKTMGQRAEDAYIEAAVVSVDNSTENVLGIILSLPNVDFEEVYSKVEEALGIKKDQISPDQKPTT